MKTKIISIVVSSIVSIFLITGFSLIYREQIKSVSEQNRLLAMREVTMYNDRIQNIINNSLRYAEFIDILVQMDPDLTEKSFEEYSEYIYREQDIIKNIAIAPNAVIKYIYPIEGNEAALNHDLLADEERREFVEEAIETKESVTQGPVKARQGGYLVFNRKAIFLDESDEFWGFSAITIDFDKVIEAIELLPKKDGYQFALKVEKVNGEEDFVWGMSEIFEQDYMGKDISLPNQTWQIAVYPEEGWSNRENHSKGITYFFYGLVALSFTSVYLTATHYQNKISISKKDPLTGTLNNTAFKDFAKKQLTKNKKICAICVIDLNDFKEVNDNFGHPIGDAVLIEMSDRIKSIIRNTDRVSRFGGDEYIIFINGLEREESLGPILERLKNVARDPILVGDIEIEAKFAIGCAVSPRDGVSYEKLYAIADKRMYKNKEMTK